MKFWVGVTDKKWFDYLSSISPDEVNFWKPGGQGFGAIEIGAPFLFKLHSPINKIVGGGFFIRSEKLPLSMAWEAFGNKNGTRSISDLRNAINNYRKTKEYDPTIGCIILNEPFFFSEDNWVEVPTSFPLNHPTGITYEMDKGDGKKLWLEVMERLVNNERTGIVAEPLSGYGKEYIRKTRLGQGGFASLVRAAYKRQCAISGEKALPVLQAAHIKQFSEDGPNRIDNGLLLRSDLHILFDKYYLTITPDLNIEVSRRIKEEFDNGKHYYSYHGKKLKTIPKNISNRPGLEFINWHNDKYTEFNY